MKSDIKQAEQKESNKQEIDKLNQDFGLGFEEQTLNLNRDHTDVTLKKYQIDSVERIYNKLPLREIKVNQFVGEGETSSLGNLLPTMGV